MSKIEHTETKLKKTDKIITNKPVDPNEFSYFKKEGSKPEKPKPWMETEEDLNVFKQSTKRPVVNSKPLKEEDFDFDF